VLNSKLKQKLVVTKKKELKFATCYELFFLVAVPLAQSFLRAEYP